MRRACDPQGFQDHLPRQLPTGNSKNMDIDKEEVARLVGEEGAEWYSLTPQQRFAESTKLWDTYPLLGGSLDPEPDARSPFFDPDGWRENAAHGRPSVRILRGG